jgi:serine/threonine protein kinase
MGEVDEARDTRLGRDVAVRVLPEDLSDHPKALARFESERAYDDRLFSSRIVVDTGGLTRLLAESGADR